MQTDAIQPLLGAGADLAKYGLTGVAIAALVVVIALGYLFLRAVTVQTREHREAMREINATMKDTIDRNTYALTENAKATAALSASLPNVCHFRN